MAPISPPQSASIKTKDGRTLFNRIRKRKSRNFHRNKLYHHRELPFLRRSPPERSTLPVLATTRLPAEAEVPSAQFAELYATLTGRLESSPLSNPNSTIETSTQTTPPNSSSNTTAFEPADLLALLTRQSETSPPSSNSSSTADPSVQTTASSSSSNTITPAPYNTDPAPILGTGTMADGYTRQEICGAQVLARFARRGVIIPRDLEVAAGIHDIIVNHIQSTNAEGLYQD